MGSLPVSYLVKPIQTMSLHFFFVWIRELNIDGFVVIFVSSGVVIVGRQRIRLKKLDWCC